MWTEAGMCRVVSGPVVSPVLPTAKRKCTSPYKITNYQDKFGKAQKKKKETQQYFLFAYKYIIFQFKWLNCIDIPESTVRILRTHAIKMNAHKSECFLRVIEKLCAQKLCVDESCLQLYHIQTWIKNMLTNLLNWFKKYRHEYTFIPYLDTNVYGHIYKILLNFNNPNVWKLVCVLPTSIKYII